MSSNFILNRQISVLPSYQNQPIDLLCKSIDWFLCKGNTGFGLIDASYDFSYVPIHMFTFTKEKNKINVKSNYFHLNNYQDLIRFI